MSRDATNKAKDTFKQSKALTQDASGKANELYGQLTPFYSGEMTNPQGFAPGDVSAMNTAAQESTGGGVSGAVGEGNLKAARNRNSAGYGGALDESVRNAMRTNADEALGVQQKNALLKESQRQAGAEGLKGLYGTENQDVLSSLGLQTGATNAETEAGKSGWFQNMLGAVNAASGAYGAYKGH